MVHGKVELLNAILTFIYKGTYAKSLRTTLNFSNTNDQYLNSVTNMGTSESGKNEKEEQRKGE